MPDVLLVVDMQEAGIRDGRQHDLDGVVNRINTLCALVRATNGTVIFVQHDGVPGDAWEPHTPGWEISARIHRVPADRTVRKRTNDAFFQTLLDPMLHELAPNRVIVCGWATDFCVDSSVRSAVVRGHRVVVAADAHTCDTRSHLSAANIIAHHNCTWPGLIAPGSIHVQTVAEICAGDGFPSRSQ